MTWKPKYTISDKLLFTMREIGESLGEIKSLSLSEQTLAKLELDARELSSYASTSIEGNPLPLTDVKRLLKTRKNAIRDTECEVLNYNKALKSLYGDVRSNVFQLNVKTLEKVQGVVVDGLMDNPSHIGALRQSPVIIRNPKKIGEIVFIPPDSKDIRKLTSGLLEFIKEHGSISQREYGELVSRSLASRKLDFDKLLRLNLIQAKGVGRGTYYILSS